MNSLSQLISKTKSLYSPERAERSKSFCKTGPGQYGEKDVFWGLNAQDAKKLAKEFRDLSFEDLEKLLVDEVHELRVIALLILVDNYQKTKSDSTRKEIYDYFIQHRTATNNWDLVDMTAYNIMGDYLVRNPLDRPVLYRFITSENLWERRLAMVSTMAFIRNGESEDVFKLTISLLNDKEDLMHKAAGWMLRELGKRNESLLSDFLDQYGTQMPRTMLRYAIERFPEPKRQKYLKSKK